LRSTVCFGVRPARKVTWALYTLQAAGVKGRGGWHQAPVKRPEWDRDDPREPAGSRQRSSNPASSNVCRCLPNEGEGDIMTFEHEVQGSFAREMAGKTMRRWGSDAGSI
jgi:hypothetical protein